MEVVDEGTRHDICESNFFRINGAFDFETSHGGGVLSHFCKDRTDIEQVGDDGVEHVPLGRNELFIEGSIVGGGN